MSHGADLQRIHEALSLARNALAPFVSGKTAHRLKEHGDPVTEADTAVNAVLQRALPRPGEGWLSEETADSAERLACERVWVVDPLDGTREFVDGIPEWCVSVALVERGLAVAGGICNPATGQTILGAAGEGVTLDGRPCRTRLPQELAGAEILASRSEVRRGEWERFQTATFRVRPMGSVAYKLALVAAGLTDATWTLTPKHEWDVAAGVALVLAAGGEVWLPGGGTPAFNRAKPLLPGLIAAPPTLSEPIRALLAAAAAGRV